MRVYLDNAATTAPRKDRRREKDELLPWAFIDAGVTQQYLWRERERAVQAQTTPDCRKGCQGCGLKRFEGACVGR